MGVFQAVVHDVRPALFSEDGKPDLSRAARRAREVEVVPNPEGLSPSRVAENIPGGSPPRLSSPDIARIAEFATLSGMRVTRFQLVDRRYDLLREPEQSEISSILVEAFRADGIYGLQLALAIQFPDVFLNGVELHLIPNTDIEIRHRGVLLTNGENELTGFVHHLWEALRLT